MGKKLAVLASVLVVSSGCVAVVQGNGTRREEARDVGEFQSVHIGYGFHGVVRAGSPASVVIDADENLLPFIETRIEGGALVVGSRDGAMLLSRLPVQVSVVTPTLRGVAASGGAAVTAVAAPVDAFTADASGGARLTVSDLQSERLTATASGGAHAELAGVVDRATMTASGGAVLDGKDLQAQAVSIDGSGGSTGTLRASQEVTGSLTGGSIFTVVGQPARVQVTSSGGSAVRLGD